MKKKQLINKIFVKLINFFKWLLSSRGLLITILLGIIIGGLNFVIQDRIQKQRYLELLELEIRMNASQLISEINEVNKKGFIINFKYLRDDAFKSGLSSGYLLNIKPEILSSIYVFYTVYLPVIDDLQNQNYKVINNYRNNWEECVLRGIVSLESEKCDKENKEKEIVEKTYSNYILKGDIQTLDILNKISEKFNPTQERLSSPLLKYFMGKDRLKIQE